MAKRSLRFGVAFALALIVVPFLPLFIERTLIRSFRIGNLGDKIDWGWKLLSLRDYWNSYTYMNREQQPALWLSVNAGLAVVYALLFAFGVDWIFARRQKSGHS